MSRVRRGCQKTIEALPIRIIGTIYRPLRANLRPANARTRGCGAGHGPATVPPGTLASPDRNFNFAARAIGWECQLDGTAQFMWDEIADEA
jgi:hypothetical protein